MKKLMLLCVVIGLCCFSGMSLAEDTRVAVFNLQTVLQQTPQLQMVRDKLNSRFSTRTKEVLDLRKQLAADITKLRSIPASRSSERNELQVKIINEDSSLRTKQALLQRDVMTARTEDLQNMMAKIREQAAKIARARKFQVVFSNENVAYNLDSIDITNDLVKSLK